MRKKTPFGKPLEGLVTGMALGGEGVVRTGEGVVLASGAYPGERIRLGPAQRGRGVLRASVAEVLESSPDRIAAPCPYFAQCGGCPLMGLTAHAQHAIKHDLLAAALRCDVSMHSPPPSMAYRRRARLAFRGPGRRPMALGYRLRGSHDLLDVQTCLVLAPGLSEALTAVRRDLLPLLAGEGELSLGPGRDGRAVITVRSDAAQAEPVFRAAEAIAALPAVAGLSIIAGGASVPARFGDTAGCMVGVDGHELEGEPDGFAQTHVEANALLVELVRRLAAADGTRVLELFAGYGNLTLAMAASAVAVTAVESDAAAASHCRANMQARGFKHVKVIHGAAEDHVRGPAEVVVLDPPRTGARAVVAGLQAVRPRRVVYVSCDPATLARDAAELARQGFTISEAHGIDMFPQTAHIEAVVAFAR